MTLSRMLCAVLGLSAMPCWPGDVDDVHAAEIEAVKAQAAADAGALVRHIHAAQIEALKAQLQAMLPSTRITAVSATPISGLFEVVLGRNVAFTDAAGRYFVFGHMFDMQTQRDLSANASAPVLGAGQ